MLGGSVDIRQIQLAAHMKNYGKQWKPSRVEVHQTTLALAETCLRVEATAVVNGLRCALQRVLQTQSRNLSKKVLAELIRMIRGIERHLAALLAPGGFFSLPALSCGGLAGCASAGGSSRGPPQDRSPLSGSFSSSGIGRANPASTAFHGSDLGKGIVSRIRSRFAPLSKGAKAGIALAGFLALLGASQPNEAKANGFTDVLIGSDVYNFYNFRVSGGYNDSGAQFQIDYIGPPNDNFYSNQVAIDSVNYGGAMNPVVDWGIGQSINADFSVNYRLTSLDNLANIRGPPFNFSFSFAPQNGFPVPAGIGSEPLDYTLPFSVGYSGLTSHGSIPAPYSLTHAPQTAQIPEPLTALLLGLGLAGLIGIRRMFRS